MTRNSTQALKRLPQAKFHFIAIMVSLLTCFQGRATVWTTVVAGAANTLSNWSNGTTSPTSFTTPGDKWQVTLAMTMPMPGTWTIGTISAAPDTLQFESGGTISMSGAGSTSTITIYGDLIMSGGTLSLGGAGTTANIDITGDIYSETGTISSTASSTVLNVNSSGILNMNGGTMTSNGAGSTLAINNTGNALVTGGTINAAGASGVVTATINGNTTMSAGTFNSTGAGSTLNFNSHGNFTMTGGLFNAAGAGGDVICKMYGNCSYSGTAAMTNSGTLSVVYMALPTSSGTMMIDNTSTGAWSGTNVYVDTGCTAELDGNFSTTTGSATYGVTVNGTLICPAVDFMDGSGIFKVNGVATLEVAVATGINGAITTTGTKTFATSANYIFNGTVAQVTGSFLPAALISPDTVTINNTAGVTLSQTTSTTGTLLFANGILYTGANTMSVPGVATAVVGAGATNYVDGTLIKTISGLTTINYEVGDLDYAPMNLALATAGTAGSLGLKATNGLHPSVGTSGLSTANMANHYWTITNIGAAGPATVIPKATYNATDIIGGSNSAFETQEYNGTTWLGSALASTNTSLPYTSAPNVGVALGTLAGDFIFGNTFCGTLPITGTTSLCTGTSTTLDDATSGGHWSSSATSVATIGSSGMVSAIAAGTTTISYTVGTCSVNTIVTVNPAPNAGVITGDTVVCIGKNDTLKDVTSGGVWVNTLMSIATLGTSGIVTGVSPGVDTIEYTVTNACGTAVAKYHVRVLSATSCSHLGIEPENGVATELKIFPNPSDGSFTIQLRSAYDEDVQLVITSLLGEKVKEMDTRSNIEESIQLSAAPGVYFITASTNDNRYVTKIVVR